jgi:hypothetical protein
MNETVARSAQSQGLEKNFLILWLLAWPVLCHEYDRLCSEVIVVRKHGRDCHFAA